MRIVPKGAEGAAVPGLDLAVAAGAGADPGAGGGHVPAAEDPSLAASHDHAAGAAAGRIVANQGQSLGPAHTQRVTASLAQSRLKFQEASPEVHHQLMVNRSLRNLIKRTEKEGFCEGNHIYMRLNCMISQTCTLKPKLIFITQQPLNREIGLKTAAIDDKPVSNTGVLFSSLICIYSCLQQANGRGVHSVVVFGRGGADGMYNHAESAGTSLSLCHLCILTFFKCIRQETVDGCLGYGSCDAQAFLVHNMTGAW